MLILKLSQFFIFILGKKKKFRRKLWLAVYLGRYSLIFVFALLASADKYPQEKAEC